MICCVWLIGEVGIMCGMCRIWRCNLLFELINVLSGVRCFFVDVMRGRLRGLMIFLVFWFGVGVESVFVVLVFVV